MARDREPPPRWLRLLADPVRLPGKGLRRARRALRAGAGELAARGRSTWPVQGGPLARLLPDPGGLPALAARAAEVAAAAEAALAHRFELLGAGPLVVRHGARCEGLLEHRFPPGPEVAPDARGEWLRGRVNRSNLAGCRAAWRLVSPGYAPIDWQLDLRSGWRWSARTFAPRVRFGHRPGVDVKLPWELGRMQHLPALALAFALARRGAAGLRPPERYRRELEDQLLDFLAQNPPGFGVQWACPMDVALRAMSWLLALDLLRAAGGDLAPAAAERVARGLRAHGRWVAERLERDPRGSGNHYLADLAGLVWCGAWLSGPEAGGWLGFASGELLREAAAQTGADGGGGESSTGYHRLAGELLAWGTLPLLLRGDPVPDAHLELLERVGELSRGAAAPDGAPPRIGDQDDGRALVLLPGDAGHAPLADAIQALCGGEPARLEGALIAAALAAGPGPRRRVEPPAPRAETAGGLTLRAWPDFGLWVWRGEALWLAVRAGRIGPGSRAAHAHDDALSFVLWLGGAPLVVDPGTFVYTPLPAEYERDRAAASHATLVLDGAHQNPRLPGSLWGLAPRARPEVLRAGPRELLARHAGYGAEHRRELTIDPDGLAGRDACAAPGVKRLRFPLDPAVEVAGPGPDGALTLRAGAVVARVEGGPGTWRVLPGWVAPGYGRRLPAPVLELQLAGDEARWSIRRLAAGTA